MNAPGSTGRPRARVGLAGLPRLVVPVAAAMGLAVTAASISVAAAGPDGLGRAERTPPAAGPDGLAARPKTTKFFGLLGACCLGDGSCTEVDEAMCDVLGGLFTAAATCAEVSCVQPIDLAFIIDESGSVSSADFNLQIEGLAQAVEDATVIPQNGAVALSFVTFASIATIDVPLTVVDGQATADAIASQLRSLTKSGGGTDMTAAINAAFSSFGPGPGRPGARQVICLSTDGNHNGGGATPQSAAQNAIDNGAEELDTIGIGSGINVALLQELAAIGNGIFAQVTDFDEFAATIGQKLQGVIQQLGACCLADGSCTLLNEDECVAAGGLFQGVGAPCSAGACVGDEGACCLPDLSCVEVDSEDACVALGGVFQGEDTLCGQICCEATIDFETADDGTTPLQNGQSLDLFEVNGNLWYVSGSGANNLGAAIFDTDPTGPNAGGPDPDLLVDSGNALILQELGSTLCDPNLFCVANDAAGGGTLEIDFEFAVEAFEMTLIDVDAAAGTAALVTLVDLNGFVRIYHVPAGWTGDGGSSLLDLTTLDPQPGASGAATATEDAGFLPFLVDEIRIRFGGSGGVDDVRFCRTSPVF